MLSTKFGLPNMRGSRSFIIAMFIDALGTGLFEPFSLLYFHLVAGFSLTTVGIVLTVTTFLSLPMTLLTGTLVDRFGAARILIASQVFLVVGFIGYLFVHTILAFVVTVLIVTAGDRIFWVAQPSTIAEIATTGERDRYYGFVGSIRQAGIGIGAFLAGLAVSFSSTIGYRLLAGANGFSFLIVIALLLPSLRTSTRYRLKEASSSGYRQVLRDYAFLGFVVCNIAFVLCSYMLSIALPVYIVEALHLPGWVAGVMLALNTILVVGCQPYVVRLVSPYRRPRVLMVAGLIWCVSSLLMALALIIYHFLLIPYLIIVLILYTFAGLMYGPTAFAFAAEASQGVLQGRYVAVFQFSWGIGVALTPSLFAVLFTSGHELPWIVLSLLILVAALTIFRLESRLSSQAVRM